MQKECINCGSNATKGMRENLWAAGWSMIILGCVLTAFIITAIIGIPMIIVGAVTLVVSRRVTNKQWTCKNCKTTFR